MIFPGKFKPTHKLEILILYPVFSILTANDRVQNGRTGLVEHNTDQTDLQRLIQDHRSFCWIEDSCNATHWDFAEYCYCEKCSCEPDCVINGNCCPDVLTDFWTSYIPETQLQCISLSYRGFQPAFHQKMIAKCPGSYSKSDVVKKCEMPYVSNDVDDIIPVDETASNLTYANKHCAVCNSVDIENTIHWSAAIECNTTIFTLRSYKTILRDVNTTADCDVVFRPTVYRFDQECNKVISTCNETGLWKVFDNFTNQACRLYHAPYMTRYRNPFCALCNGYDVRRYKRDSLGCEKNLPGWPSFSALLDFQSALQAKPSSIGKCSTDQVYDSVSNVCRNLECGFGNVLINGSCEQAFGESRGLCYQFYIQLTPVEDVDNKTQSARYTNFNPIYNSEASIFAFEQDILAVAKRYKAHYFHRNSSFYRTKISENSTEIYFLSLFFFIEYEVNDVAFLKDISERYEGNNISLSTGYSQISPRRNFRINFVRLLKDSTQEIMLSPWTGKGMIPFSVYDAFHFSNVTCAGETVITVTPFYFYPFVRLDSSSYTWNMNASGVTIQQLNLFIENAMFRETDNASIILVSADLFYKTVKALERESVTLPSETEGLITLILMSISAVCLLFTILTYSLFHVLRTQPGINNMILSICLILGYLLFLFGFNKNKLKKGCNILGGTIHFSWVFIFFWMNVCSCHMFRVFGSLHRLNSSSNNLTLTAGYLLYSALCSSIIVGINIGVTYFISNGSSYGYGSKKTGLCYIYEPVMIIYTMAIPAVSILLFNLVLFTVVIVRVKRSTNIQRHVQNNKNYFAIYVKLSTLTGIAWIIAIPMMLLESVVFNYLFIALTCCQGVYLMIAFICNKRVLKLYSEKFNLKKASGSSVPETRETGTKHKLSGNQSDSC